MFEEALSNFQFAILLVSHSLWSFLVDRFVCVGGRTIVEWHMRGPWVGLEDPCSIVKVLSTWQKNRWEQSRTKLGNKLWWLSVCSSLVCFKLLAYWGPFCAAHPDQKSFPRVQLYLSCISVLDLAWQQEPSNKTYSSWTAPSRYRARSKWSLYQPTVNARVAQMS